MKTVRTAQLLGEGRTKHDLARAARSGDLIRVRHGAWAEAAAADELDRHRQIVAGTWPLLGAGAVVSHASAAVLHELPLWRGLLQKVSVTRADGGHGTRTRNLHVRLAPLAPQEVTELDGYRVTTLERTAVDLACLVGYERAVAVLDAALHTGADPGLLLATVQAASGRKGSAMVRRALGFADARAESVGESVSRVRIAEVGLPKPELQFRVLDRNGIFVARVDFCWPEYGVVGEFDGAVKYTGGPEEVAAAVMAERRRESDIEAVGWRVVRWIWSELADRSRFRMKIASELARGRRPAV